MTNDSILETTATPGSRTVLVLHGGGGPRTVSMIATHLDDHLGDAITTIVPTHPGWNGTPRADELATVADIARLYVAQLAEADLRDVVVMGSSLGGWMAAEMTLADTEGRITGLVLINSVGVSIEGERMVDFSSLDLRGVAEYSYHDADRFEMDPASISPEQGAVMRGNMATMATVAGAMYDPSLLGRLSAITVPTLVVWGESDRIVRPAYGRAMAAAIPGARFAPVERAGHLPQIEQPAATFALIDGFLG